MRLKLKLKEAAVMLNDALAVRKCADATCGLLNRLIQKDLGTLTRREFSLHNIRVACAF